MTRLIPVLCVLASIAVVTPLAVWWDRCASRRIRRAYREAGVRYLPPPEPSNVVPLSRDGARVIRIDSGRGRAS